MDIKIQGQHIVRRYIFIFIFKIKKYILVYELRDNLSMSPNTVK